MLDLEQLRKAKSNIFQQESGKRLPKFRRTIQIWFVEHRALKTMAVVGITQAGCLERLRVDPQTTNILGLIVPASFMSPLHKLEVI